MPKLFSSVCVVNACDGLDILPFRVGSARFARLSMQCKNETNVNAVHCKQDECMEWERMQTPSVPLLSYLAITVLKGHATS
jgi:hypothetical protein